MGLDLEHKAALVYTGRGNLVRLVSLTDEQITEVKLCWEGFQGVLFREGREYAPKAETASSGV